MKKTVFLLLGIALFALYVFCLYQWILSGHTFKDVWQAATSDWFLAVTIFDMAIFSLLCLIWLYRDMSRRGFSGGRKIMILLACLITGVVVVFLYLAFRRPDLKQA
ncbi:MAG TPA: hypothetical protein VGB71_14150 [Flavisolibacter sp.]|jgi:hypothetical protein